ncbi:MAG: glycoside hydrolase family 16 protein [Paludibacter sp.]|nr:glycoside hydrolase family 16 protein [Paludibacter sp.]
MKYLFLVIIAISPTFLIAQNLNMNKPDRNSPKKIVGMNLVFSEEFNYTGKPDTTFWNFENGFKRNKELQWYQSDNANCIDGRLLIEGRKTKFQNPNFDENSNSWKQNRKIVNYTSSSITTCNKKSWLFGRFEIRARIDTAMGAWPAIWLLGVDYEWPSCGEIDMLEFYRYNDVPSILANVAHGTLQRWKANWDMTVKPLDELSASDKNWTKKYHVWRMDWTKDSINLYVDDLLLNTTLLSETVNPDGTNPFLQPQYLLLNLALGENGGNPEKSNFPITFEVDYVRVYQKK